MDVKLIVKIVVGVVLFFIALSLVWQVLGWLSVILYAAFSLLVIAALAYAIYRIFLSPQAKTINTIKNYRLTGPKTQVPVFRTEPGVKDLVTAHDELGAAQMEISGDVFLLPRDTEVILLEDTGKEAVKILIKGAKKKLDTEGWVDRASLAAEIKQITG